MDRALAPGFSIAMPIARSGLDIPLHDLAGKLRGQSLSQMWNRPQGGPLTLSWTVSRRIDRSVLLGFGGIEIPPVRWGYRVRKQLIVKADVCVTSVPIVSKATLN